MHIYISKLTIIGSNKGFLTGQCQAIIWTNAAILLNGPLGTNLSPILVEIYTFSFQENAIENIIWKIAAIWKWYLIEVFKHSM